MVDTKKRVITEETYEDVISQIMEIAEMQMDSEMLGPYEKTIRKMDFTMLDDEYYSTVGEFVLSDTEADEEDEKAWLK